jgi:hypothetical protein
MCNKQGPDGEEYLDIEISEDGTLVVRVPPSMTDDPDAEAFLKGLAGLAPTGTVVRRPGGVVLP